MKKTFIATVSMSIFLAVLAAEVKIGVVNPAFILQNIDKGKEAYRRINEVYQSRQQKAQSMQAEIEKLTRDLNNPALNAETQQRKALELENKKKELQRYGEDAQQELLIQQQKELEPIQKELVAIIEELAKAEKFTLILDLSTAQNQISNIVYFDQAIDLSMRVAQIYNQKYPVAAKQTPAKPPEQPVKK